MSTPSPRQYLALAGSTVTAALAGCIGESDSDDEATPEPTSTSTGPTVEASSTDTILTVTLDGRADDFDSLVVDIDRVEFIGQSGTEDATVQIGDTGIDLTTLSEDSKTYLDEEPFPSGAP